MRLCGGEIDDDGQRHCGDHLHDGHIGRCSHRLLHDMAAHPVGFVAKTVDFVMLPAKQFDHFVRRDTFFDNLGDVAHCALRIAAGITQANIEGFYGDCDDRHHHQTEQGELPVEVEQPAEQSGDDDGVADDNSHHIGGSSGHLCCVEGYFGDEIAGGMVVIKSRGKCQ